MKIINMEIVDEELQSRVLKFIRFPLACMVVFIHCKMDENLVMPSLTNLSFDSLFDVTQIMFSSILTCASVPIFFLISGFLFFLKRESPTVVFFVEKIKKRFYSLFIPYFLWIFIIILKIIIIKVIGCIIHDRPLYEIFDYFEHLGGICIFWDCYVWGSNINFLGLMSPDKSAPLLYPFWFIRDLMVVIVVSPILYILIKKLNKWFLIFLVSLYVLDLWPNIHGFSAISITFFSLGAYFSLFNKNIVNEFKKVRYVALFLYLFLFINIFFSSNKSITDTYLYPFFVISSVVCFFNFSIYLVSRNKFNIFLNLSETTFFIYASHAIVGIWLATIILNIFFQNLVYNYWLMFLLYFLKPILSIIICLCLYYLLKYCFPRVLNVLIGKKDKKIL